MPAEADDIDVFKRFLEMAAEEYAKASSGEDRSFKFFEEVTALFDDYLARSILDDAGPPDSSPRWRRLAGRVLKPASLLVYAAKYGTLPRNGRLTEAFHAGLERQKRIKQGERRTLNIHSVIRFSDDGSCAVVLAPREAYGKARRALVVVGILTLAAFALAWTTLSQFLVGIPACYTLGSILGWLWRDTYDSAWGRDKLARRLCMQLPFLKLRDAASLYQ
jgi:hypothetical protein